MAGSEFLAIGYGLASALSWGAGDFSGGLATRRNHVYGVVLLSQMVGALFLMVVAVLLTEPFPLPLDLVYGGGAGIGGTIGLVALYRGLARGRMGLVAPLAAVVTAVLPVSVNILAEGSPAGPQLVGFGLAIVAVWLISPRHNKKVAIQAQELVLAVIAGSGFGIFLILIDRVNAGAILWPLVSARVASISLLAIIMVFTSPLKKIPTAAGLPVIMLAGIFDTGGNAFFALATQSGRLDVAAILSSLYPAVTIALAWLILKERLLPQQWGGVAAALLAIVLISV